MRPDSRVRVAIVGAGYVASFHLEALAGIAGVELVALCDVDRDRAAAAAARWNVPHVVSSVQELARLGVEVAHVLVPPDLHYQVTRELLDCGIGAFVEKPFVLESAHGRELQRSAAERGLPLGVNHNNVFHPAFQRLAGVVRSGRIGRVTHVQVSMTVDLPQLDAGDFSHWMFRSPRNIIFEQATHPFSQVHALIGRVRSASTALLGTRELASGQVFHDRWLVAADAERGTAQLYLAFSQGFERNTLQVLATDGVAEADLLHNTVWVEEKTAWMDFWNSFLAGWRRGRSIAADAARVLWRYGRYTLGLGPRQDAYFAGMRESIERFYGALAEGRALPVGADAATEVLEWCEAAARPIPGRSLASQRVPAPGPPRRGEVAVLGGTGFIGRRVVAALRSRGLPVTLLTRSIGKMPPEIAAAAERGEIRVVRGRLEDAGALPTLLEGVQTVVHLATGNGTTWAEVSAAMIGGTRALAEAALEQGVDRFVYVSSIAAIYGGADCGHAEIEDSMDVDPRPEARDLYSRGKAATEVMLQTLYQERGLPLVIVRPGIVMGEGTPMQHPGLGLWIRDNQCIAWGTGRTFLPVVLADDVADAIVRVVRFAGDALHGRALNLCTRTPVSAEDLVKELARATGRPIHFHPQPLWLTQVFEIGKWVVKRAARKPNVRFPAYRDLTARSWPVPFTARTAREVLGWRPVEDREAFLDRAVRIYNGRSESRMDPIETV